MKEVIPWVSFCMSTFNRPKLLQQQLKLVLSQSFKDFDVVISDNDPACSAREVIEGIADLRLKYFSNVENLGMTKSFNKSIERSTAKYVVMITDDDPISPGMLEAFHELISNYPGYSIYMGCSRVGKKENNVEIFDNQNFSYQILHPKLTTNLLWSSCIFEKKTLLRIGGMPDYGSPHLADHAMMALCGNSSGGVIINKMFSTLTSHAGNFSKSNIDLYYVACIQFYSLMSQSVVKEIYVKYDDDALIKHLERWFLISMFSLRRYFTYNSKNMDMIGQVSSESQKILQLNFMKQIRTKYYMKLISFELKKQLYKFNILR